MPPFKGTSHVFSGEAAGVLWDLGHGDRIAIVGSSYPPSSHRLVNLRSESVTRCLEAVLNHVPIEGVIMAMHPDPGIDRNDEPEAFAALDSFTEVAEMVGFELKAVPQMNTSIEQESEQLLVTPDSTEMLTPKEAGELLGLSSDAIGKRLHAGTLPGNIEPGKLRVLASGVRTERAALLRRLGAREFYEDAVNPTLRLGFYALLQSDPNLVVFKAGDERKFACVMLDIGHAQG